MKIPRIRKISIKKKHFKAFIHINFIVGILYAFYHFVRTPKSIDMATRRLWAAETWIVFSLYSLFIYLFALEVSYEDGEPIINKIFTIRRKVKIRESAGKVKKFFFYILNNPDKYAFNTHQGVFPIDKDISKVGARFYTKEKFFLFPIRLDFKTTEVDENSFEFKLVKPLGQLNITGNFTIEKTKKTSSVYLSVNSERTDFLKHVLLAFIFVFPFRGFISRQLDRELKFIKRNIDKNS